MSFMSTNLMYFDKCTQSCIYCDHDKKGFHHPKRFPLCRLQSVPLPPPFLPPSPHPGSWEILVSFLYYTIQFLGFPINRIT